MILVPLRLKGIKLVLSGKEINLTSDNTTIKSDNFNVDKNGSVECNNINIKSGKINLKGNGNFIITDSYNGSSTFINGTGMLLGKQNDFINITYGEGDGVSYTGFEILNPSGVTWVGATGIETPKLTQTSREENKKNFEKLQDGLDIIKNTEIYKYNLKSQSDDDKKHIGFVIGRNYKYSSDITSVDSEGKEIGVDTYSMISVAYKAIQEQQEQIEQLQEKDKQNAELIENLIKRIKTLEKGVNK